MKCLKALGLTIVVAAALMAFLEANAASATTLCTATETSCAPARKITTTQDSVIKASLSGSAVIEETNGTELVTCTVGAMEAAISNEGSSTATVSGPITSLTWGKVNEGCNHTVDTLTTGSFEIHHLGGTDNGTVTFKNTSITINIFGVSCVYTAGSGTDLGTLVGGASPTFTFKVSDKKESGGFLCPEDVLWTATYSISQPNPLYVEP